MLPDSEDRSWCVYILTTSDYHFYTGITNNMVRRWQKHRKQQGAKYFRGKHPIALSYQEPDHSRSSASKREYAIKQLTHQQKQQLIIASYGPLHNTAHNHE